MTITPIKHFDTAEQATEWLYQQVDDPCNDNYRLAFHDDHDAMVEYNRQIEEGCCGSYDAIVTIGGRVASIGCNYGH